jgi:hypothetical protein
MRVELPSFINWVETKRKRQQHPAIAPNKIYSVEITGETGWKILNNKDPQKPTLKCQHVLLVLGRKDALDMALKKHIILALDHQFIPDLRWFSWNSLQINPLLFFLFIYSFIHMCIHCLGHFSPLPPSPVLCPLSPSVPGRNCSAFITNFVEKKRQA